MHRTGRGKKSHHHLVIARGRIDGLYRLSVEKLEAGDDDLARRYTSLAKRIGMRYTVRIPRPLKQMTCRECALPLLPGRTSRVRIRKGRRVVTCLGCGRSMRYPFKGGDGR